MRFALCILCAVVAGATAGCDLISSVGDEAVIAETAEHLVIERAEYFSEATYHYAPAGTFDQRDGYTFLFGACPTDCDEVLEQVGFAPSGQHIAFRLSSSNQSRPTRLLLFSCRGQTVRTLLDLANPAVTGYTFTDSTLVYTLGSGAVRSVPLD